MAGGAAVVVAEEGGPGGPGWGRAGQTGPSPAQLLGRASF